VTGCSAQAGNPADAIWRIFEPARLAIAPSLRGLPFATIVQVSPVDRFMQEPARAFLLVFRRGENPLCHYTQSRFMVMDTEAATPDKWMPDFLAWLGRHKDDQ
jgi:hypothetical protein